MVETPQHGFTGPTVGRVDGKEAENGVILRWQFFIIRCSEHVLERRYKILFGEVEQIRRHHNIFAAFLARRRFVNGQIERLSDTFQLTVTGTGRMNVGVVRLVTDSRR